jgi:hypothetical protein
MEIWWFFVTLWCFIATIASRDCNGIDDQCRDSIAQWLGKPATATSHLPTLVGGDWNHGFWIMTCMTFQKQLGMENHPN